MDSQKNENLLNLALDTPETERERSLELNVGFDRVEKTWEVIVKYHGSLQELTLRRIVVEELIAGYAILTVPESEMDILTETEQIEYVEKPKRLFSLIWQGIRPPAILQTVRCSGILPVKACWFLLLIRESATGIRIFAERTGRPESCICGIRCWTESSTAGRSMRRLPQAAGSRHSRSFPALIRLDMEQR